MAADVDGDGANEVIIGCLDKTVTALKFSWVWKGMQDSIFIVW